MVTQQYVYVQKMVLEFLFFERGRLKAYQSKIWVTLQSPLYKPWNLRLSEEIWYRSAQFSNTYNNKDRLLKLDLFGKALTWGTLQKLTLVVIPLISNGGFTLLSLVIGPISILKLSQLPGEHTAQRYRSISEAFPTTISTSIPSQVPILFILLCEEEHCTVKCLVQGHKYHGGQVVVLVLNTV